MRPHTTRSTQCMMADHITIGVTERVIMLDKVTGDETISPVTVVDRSRTLKGVVSLRELLRAEDSDQVESVINSAVSVKARESNEFAARRCLDGGLLAIPVVDNESRLVGLLTIDDAIRIIRAAED